MLQKIVFEDKADLRWNLQQRKWKYEMFQALQNLEDFKMTTIHCN